MIEVLHINALAFKSGDFVIGAQGIYELISFSHKEIGSYKKNLSFWNCRRHLTLYSLDKTEELDFSDDTTWLVLRNSESK